MSRRTATSCTAGMAVLWYFMFKRLRYPVLYAYVRTGDDGALVAQGIHNIVLVACAFAVLYLVSKRGTRLFETAGARAALLGMGLAGGIGLVLLGHSDFSTPARVAGACAGGALVGLFAPVYAAFWATAGWKLGKARVSRAIACSFAIFAAAALLLNLMGADRLATTVACPFLSAALALACLRAQDAQNPADDGADAASGVATPLPAAADAARDAAVAVEAPREGAGDSRPGNAAPDPLPGQRAAAAPRASGAPRAAEGRPAPGEAAAGAFDAFCRECGLSKREAEIAALAYRNYNARRIAGELFIAESTVYTHLKRIYRKADVHSKQELIDRIDAYRGPGA